METHRLIIESRTNQQQRHHQAGGSESTNSVSTLASAAATGGISRGFGTTSDRGSISRRSSAVSFDDLTYSTASSSEAAATSMASSEPRGVRWQHQLGLFQSFQPHHPSYQHPSAAPFTNQPLRGGSSFVSDTTMSMVSLQTEAHHHEQQHHEQQQQQQQQQQQYYSNVYHHGSMIGGLLHQYLPAESWHQRRRHRRHDGENDDDSTAATTVATHQLLWRCLTSPRVVLTVAVCVVIAGNLLIGSQFFGRVRELGWAGHKAQNLADRVKVGLLNNKYSSNSKAARREDEASLSAKNQKATKKDKKQKATKKDKKAAGMEVALQAIPLAPLKMDGASTAVAGTKKKKEELGGGGGTTTTSSWAEYDAPPPKSKASSSSPQPAPGCEATVMLLRHCEKGTLKSHCNYLGYERSVYLASLFGDSASARWPAPAKIYALNKGRKHKKVNLREQETVDALAARHGLVVNNDYSVETGAALAGRLLNEVVDGGLCGRLVVVSWKHSDLPLLAQHLGCGPLEGCPLSYDGDDFDSVWMVRYVYADFRTSKVDPAEGEKWNVFGSVQKERFDPLAYSKAAGDYPPGGKPATGGIATWSTEKVFFG